MSRIRGCISSSPNLNNDCPQSTCNKRLDRVVVSGSVIVTYIEYPGQKKSMMVGRDWLWKMGASTLAWVGRVGVLRKMVEK